ncbi:restriction endonuclease subunit S [Chryseobacterium aurantiacum]|uniref:restriction endonuclease subunit S n=1 Tax=Chryseobacterium aurantiacum TaxID=2116499 RepID=UPI0013C50CE4|nr:restriction endonuclease subunit S [Chryseobacterium aurantiacum]
MADKELKVSKVPNLRFPEFNGEWEVKKLGEIAVFSKGKGISKSDIDGSGITECIRYGELYTHYKEVIIDIKSKTNINKSDLILSEENDVIIPASGETKIDIATASCILKSGIALGGDLNIIKSNNINGVFLAYYLNSKKKREIANLAQGISVVHLYSSQLSSLHIILPELNEQQKISGFLTLLDERIQTQNKILRELIVLKSSFAKKIFERDLFFKNEMGFSYDEWKEMKLREVVNINMGQSPESSSYNLENVGYPLIQGNADIVDRVSEPRQYTSKPTKFCEIGDILLTVRAPVGYVARSKHNACIGRGVCSIKTKGNTQLEYVYQFLQYFEMKWKSLEQGSTFTAVNSSDIGSITIMIPSVLEQKKIVNFLSAINKKIVLEKCILEVTEKQKKKLLSQLFV